MCSLEVSGSEKSIKRFKERSFPDGKFSFNHLVPMPEKVRSLEHCAEGMEPLYAALDGKKPSCGWDWYTWSIANWGTKWDVSEIIDLIEDETNITLSFDTAWSPPCRWLEKASSKFPSLTFVLKYGEPGMCFAGEYTACKKLNIKEDISFEEGSDEYYELVGYPEEDIE
jgi:hypothetical protein